MVACNRTEERESSAVKPQSEESHSLVADSSVEVVGTYSNVRATEEHAYGIEVDLWRSGNTLFGILYYAEGIMGDAPRGLLQDVVYQPGTRLLSFSVKLSRGLHFCKDHSNVPSRDVVEFSGTHDADSLVGTMTLIDSLDAKIVSSERIALRKSDERTKFLNDWTFQNVAEWKQRYWEAIHKPLGPKW